MNYTPGPWFVTWSNRERYSYEIYTKPCNGIASVREQFGAESPIPSNQQANARLIAAAPELLEMLEELCMAATYHDADREMWDRAQMLVTKVYTSLYQPLTTTKADK